MGSFKFRGFFNPPRMHQVVANSISNMSLPPPKEAVPPFRLYIAADIYGKKHNVEVQFPIRPTMIELINTTTTQFDLIMRTNRP
eukprot:gene21922-8546_t